MSQSEFQNVMPGVLYTLTQCCICSSLTTREKANLAVTLTNAKNEVLAHAAFFDYPIGDIVDQAHWEPFLHENFNTEKCTVCIIS